MSKLTLSLITIALAVLVITAKIAQAAPAEITLKNMVLVYPPDNVTNFMIIRSNQGGTNVDFKVTYSPNPKITKHSGTIKGLQAYADWRAGDFVTVTGTPTNYENGKLTVQANSVLYSPAQKLSIKTINATVNYKKIDENKIFISFKDNNKYILQEVGPVGQTGGPRLTGVTSLAELPLGSKVKLTQLWQMNALTKALDKVRDLEVTRLSTNTKDSVRVLSLVRNDGVFTLEPNYPQPLSVKPGNKLVIQNNSNLSLFLKVAEANRVKFAPLLPTGFTTIAANTAKQFTINSQAAVGRFSLPFKTDDTDLAPVTITLEIEVGV